MSKIQLFWFPGTWEVDWGLAHGEQPSAKNFTGLGLWLVDNRFPDRLPLNVFEHNMLCPPDYEASFGPIPAAGSSVFNAIWAPSYQESIAHGLDSAVAQITKVPLGTNLVLGGYSQGAELCNHVVREIKQGKLIQYLPYLKAVYTFGNPCRSPGRTFPNGNVLPWGGIAGPERYTECPPHVLWRDYAFPNDMYANANPKSYLHDFYEGLTDIQFHDPFKAVMEVFGHLTQTDLMILKGAQPTNFLWVITHIPQFVDIATKAANSIGAAIRFADGSHAKYAEWQIVPGLTPIFHAIRSMKYLAKELGYDVRI